MAQPFLPVADAFRAVTRKHDSADITKLWTNTWAIWKVGTEPQPTDAVFDVIAEFERFGMYAGATFQDILLYPWEYGKNPAGPTPPIWEKTYNQVGEVPGTNGSAAWQGGGPIGADVCVLLKLIRSGIGPRNGKHFLRGSLEKNDVEALSLGQERTYSNAGNPALIPEVWQAHANAVFPPFLAPNSAATAPILGIVHSHRAAGVIATAAIGGVATVQVTSVADLQRHKRHR